MPWSMLELPKVYRNPSTKHSLVQLQKIDQVKISFHLHLEQDAHKSSTNSRHLNSSWEKPRLHVGGCMWLLKCNMKTTRSCNKLDYQRLAPFIIINLNQSCNILFRSSFTYAFPPYIPHLTNGRLCFESCSRSIGFNFASHSTRIWGQRCFELQAHE